MGPLGAAKAKATNDSRVSTAPTYRLWWQRPSCAVDAKQSPRIDCGGRDCPVLCMLIEKLALEMGLGPPTSESIMSVSQHPLKPVLGQAAPLTL